MSLPLPRRADKLVDWAQELIDECYTSRETRADQITTWKSYYYTGRSDGMQTRYNRCYSHIDRLTSLLFSPVDVRFSIEYDSSESKETIDIGATTGRYLNREFHRTGLDLSFASGINWSLVKGCMLLKTLWGHDGLEGWLVHPEVFGVLREDIAELDRQEAFVHTSYLTKSQFYRTIDEHPDRDDLMKRADRSARAGKDMEKEESFFHQVVMGGTAAPVQTQTAQGTGQVTIINIPTPQIDPKVAARLIRVDELWVMDRQRDDYTTIKLANNEILVEGKYKRRNLSGVRGEQPFHKICPNEVDGYFWGTSEIAQIWRLQDLLNDQLTDLSRMIRLKADPPRAATGFTGINQEKYKTLKRPGGFISEENPNAKIQMLAEEIPEALFMAIAKTIEYFDDVAGFTPILSGQGDTGVRAGNQAQTLTRNASPRLRDRALICERQAVDVGDFALKLLSEKNAEVFDTEKKQKYMLKQMPDGYRVSIDSHTSSPIFSEDAERKAFLLARSGAISGADLIQLVHPPHEDTLVMNARAKEEAQAKLMAQHPELLMKGKKK